MTATLTGDKFAEAAEILSLSDDYKVLRKFVPRDRYADHRWDLGEPIPLHRAIYVDVETTGLDRDGDEIIDLGLLPFTFDREGNVYDVGPAVSMLEEPKRGIPKEIQAIAERPAMAELLDSMRNPSLRVRALGSPIEAKTLLQARRYRACYAGGRFQYWYKDVKPDDVEAELAWAEEEAYSSPDVVKISARDRYSVRAA
jgi:hypothetical protein